jgi:hypothetical protein
MNTQPTAPSSTSIELPESVQNIGDNISQSFNNISQSVNSSLDGFSQQAEAGVEASSGFLDSNSIIAKFAFLILVIIVFLFLLNLGILAIQYFMGHSNSPYLIDGMISGNQGQTITQDPKDNNSILIKRSNNEESGIEFTWSTWIRIDELKSGTDINKYQHVFHKGEKDNFNEDGIAKVNNAPGLYIKQTTNTNTANIATLRVIMSTTESGNDNFIEVDDIPLKQWVNVIIRLQNTTLDVYINGTVSGRYNLSDVPFQNFYDVHVCQNNGFTGNLSNLRYYNSALNIFQITKIVNAGPNLTPLEESQKLQKSYNYLSTSWYTSKL